MWNHGYWRGGNVGYDPANQRVFSQTQIQKMFKTAATTSQTLYTVTTGKTLWITDLIYANVSGSTNNWTIQDAATAVAPVADTVYTTFRQQFTTLTGTTTSLHFTFPASFTTAVSLLEGTAGEKNLTIIGFEEET